MAFEKFTNVSEIEDEEDLDEEPGEEIESAPPLKVGEEREINTYGLKKKLINSGHGWETPEFGDEVTVHYVGTLLDGTKFDSSRDRGEPFTFKIGHGQIVSGLDHGLITMKKGETALFTLPSDLANGALGAVGVPPNSDIRYELELVSWTPIMDVCKDDGVIKKTLLKGEKNEKPSDLDEVTVKYRAELEDGSIVAETPEGGSTFYVKDGHFCSALGKVVKTMKRGERAVLTVQPHYAFGEHGRDAIDGFNAIPSNAALNIDLELVSFKTVIDVTGDLNVVKKILREGEGFSANEGTSVRIRYTAMLEDGIVFERVGLNGGELFEFVTDEEQVICGLDQAAATMKKGELSIVTIKPEYGFRNIEVKRDLAIVPACSTLIYEVEMVDFTKEKESWEMNDQEKVEAASKKKEEGNLLFKIGKYQRATKKYDQATDYVNDGDFGDDAQKLVRSLRVSCWLNNAACSLKLNDFQGGIKLCSKVLDIESHNIKALYRRAQSYIKTADLNLAELDVKKALEVDPQNREVKSIQKRLKQLQAESNKRDAKLYSNMFAQIRKDSAVVSKRLKVEKVEDTKRGLIESMTMEKLVVNFEPTSDEMVVDSC